VRRARSRGGDSNRSPAGRSGIFNDRPAGHRDRRRRMTPARRGTSGHPGSTSRPFGARLHRSSERTPLHRYLRIAGIPGPLFQKSCVKFRKCNTTAFFRSRPATLRPRCVAGSLIATSPALIPTGRRGKVMSSGQRVRGKCEIEQEQLGLTNAQASDGHQRRHRDIARIILAPLGRQPLKGLLE